MLERHRIFRNLFPSSLNVTSRILMFFGTALIDARSETKLILVSETQTPLIFIHPTSCDLEAAHEVG